MKETWNTHMRSLMDELESKKLSAELQNDAETILTQYLSRLD